MAKLALKALFLLSIILFQLNWTISRSQEQAQTIEPNDQEPELEGAGQDDENMETNQQFQADGQPNKPSEEQIQQMIQNLYTVCIIISKHQVNTYGKETIDSLLKRFENQKDKLDLFNKMMVDHVKECTKSLDHSKLGDVIQELQERKFDINNYQHLFNGIVMDTYKTIANIQFAQDEQQILKFIEDLEKKWDQQQQKDQDKLEDLDGELVWSGDLNEKDKGENDADIEPKLFGYSLSSIPKYTGLLYLLVVIGIICFIIYCGLKHLSDTEPKKSPSKLKKKKTN